MADLRLYDYFESGNAYKVRLLLSLLGRDFERVHLDILKGETRSDAFVAKNPNHRVPTLELGDGRILAESNAILFYLAQGTRYWPGDDFERARVMQWMCFEQYSHEPFIAVARFWHFSGQAEARAAELPAKMEGGSHALSVMDGHLEGRDWFVGSSQSIADIALYAYTHVAHEGGFDLSGTPNVRRWIERFAAQPGHVGIDEDTGRRVDWP